jgi:hypothetical protein
MEDLGLRTFTAPPNGKKRRSTRVFQPIALSIYARNKLGNAFKESTTASTVNCHGCMYSSRHEYQSGSWVTLEIPREENSERPRAVRAQVRYIRLPQSPRDLYQVGVELEAPGNVWGIKSPPEDWLRFPALPAGFSELPASPAPQNAGNEQKPAAAPASASPANRPDAGKPVRVVVSPDQLLRALEAKLQQFAEKAVATAVASQVNMAVNQAAKAIDNFVQASIRRAEEHCAQYRDKLLASSHEALMARLKTDLAEADTHLRQQLDACVARAQEAAERLERSAAQVQPALVEAQGFLGKAAREFQEQFSASLRDAGGRAASDFDRTAGGLAERRLARLAEQAEETGKAAATRLEAKADEVRLAIETASGTALAEFHVMARNELEHAVDDTRQTVESSLNQARQTVESSLSAFAADTRADWEARQRDHERELQEAGRREIEEFRRRLEGILNTSMVAAVSAINEHSRSLLTSLAQGAEQPLPETQSGHAAD